jgi:hypothetical protein
MQEMNRFALKEWAVILKALSEGRQVLLLRKGGLVERNKGFTVEHTEFFLFPTYLHQQRKGIVPAWTAELHQILASPPPEDRVVLTHYAVVRDAFRITDRDRLGRITGRHVFNDEEIQKRFFYGKTPGLHLILLRVFRLPEPIQIPSLAQYAGCRSWVDLEQDLPTTGCRPVVDDGTFDREIRRVTALLRSPDLIGRPPQERT